VERITKQRKVFHVCKGAKSPLSPKAVPVEENIEPEQPVEAVPSESQDDQIETNILSFENTYESSGVPAVEETIVEADLEVPTQDATSIVSTVVSMQPVEADETKSIFKPGKYEVKSIFESGKYPYISSEEKSESVDKKKAEPHFAEGYGLEEPDIFDFLKEFDDDKHYEMRQSPICALTKCRITWNGFDEMFRCSIWPDDRKWYNFCEKEDPVVFVELWNNPGFFVNVMNTQKSKCWRVAFKYLHGSVQDGTIVKA